MTAAISVENLTVRYGEVTALSGVSFDVRPGTITGLLGMNGSGKSTLYASVMGLVKPVAGGVRIFGSSSAAARGSNAVAYVPQSESVDWNFPVSVRDVVMMGRYGRMGFSRRPRRPDQDAVDTALERVGLTGLASRSIGALSGGQRKRAFVARGIAQDARLLLLDEPFAGVDTGSEATLTELLRELRAEGRTILLSTHDLGGVPELCDDVILLHRHVLFQGPSNEALTPDRLALAFGVRS
jgi:manganese transport system ATP-binding protein